MEEKRYYPYLDGLRGLSILWVILHHMPVHFPDWLAAFALRGDLGVEFFFAISGFVVFQSLLSSKNLGHFYAKRVFRILPPYWMTLLLIVGLSFLDGKLALKLNSLRAIWASFPFLFYNYVSLPPGSTMPGSLNVFWSLCFEEQFYLFIGTLYLFSGKNLRRLFLPLIGFFVILKITAALAGWVPDSITLQFRTHLRMDAVLIGCLAFDRQTHLVVSAKKFLLPGVLMFITLAIFHWQGSDERQAFIYSLLPWSIFLILLGIPASPVTMKVLSSKGLAKIGMWSYEIYLLHEIALGALVHFGISAHPWVYLGAGIATSIAAGFLFHTFFSHPLNQFLRRRLL